MDEETTEPQWYITRKQWFLKDNPELHFYERDNVTIEGDVVILGNVQKESKELGK